METMDYQKQAEDFLKEVGASVSAKFIKHDKHFPDDKEKRDIYEITITNKLGRSYIFDFGQSISASGKYVISPRLRTEFGTYALDNLADKKFIAVCKKIDHTSKPTRGRSVMNHYLDNESYSVPNSYDILTCLTKYDVGSFDNFCGDFGYNAQPLSEYPKVQKIYQAVCAEYMNVKALFTDEEIDKLQEIQ